MRRLRWPRLLGAVTLAGVLLAGCGVSAQGEPHAVDLPRRPLTDPGTAARGG